MSNEPGVHVTRYHPRTPRPITAGFGDPVGGGIARFDDLALTRGRLDRLQAQLRAADYGAALFFDPLNVRYATGTRNMSVWLLHNPARYCFVPAAGRPTLFEFPNANCQANAEGNELLAEVRAGTAHFYTMAGGHRDARAAAWAAELRALLRAAAGTNPRLAADRLDPAGLHALAAEGIDVCDGLEVAERARLQKSDAEIALLQAAVCTAEAGIAAIQAALRPGLTENDALAVLARTNLEAGGEWLESRLLTSGPRTNPWFQESSARAIEAGDMVSVDTDLIGPGGYCADISRAFVCGARPPSPRQQDLYALAHEQVHANLALLAPGVGLRELAEKAWRIPPRFERQSYGMLAHGVGLADEGPVISYDPRDPFAPAGQLQPGMCLSVESYVGEVGGPDGVKLEQQVVITETGFELLGDHPLPERPLAHG